MNKTDKKSLNSFAPARIRPLTWHVNSHNCGGFLLTIRKFRTIETMP